MTTLCVRKLDLNHADALRARSASRKHLTAAPLLPACVEPTHPLSNLIALITGTARDNTVPNAEKPPTPQPQPGCD